MNAEWIGGEGTFWIIGVGGGVFALFYFVIAIKFGKAIQSETDGCLLGICNVLLTIVGGAAGFLVAHFPLRLFTSLALAGLLPGAMTLYWISRQKPG